MRVRGFTQDDAHIFCLPEQMRARLEPLATTERSRESLMNIGPNITKAFYAEINEITSVRH